MNKLLCCKCGIEINPNEGYYNAPSGPHCIHCWTGENIKSREKGIYVIKTGAGDYLKKGYPKLSSDYSYELCFVKDIKKARKFSSFINACNFRNLSPFLKKCEIIKLE
jgi:hypothetical protein|nr:MAG TPA: Putative zinc ribbon domain [Caudoviricetes sp.]